MRGRAGPALPLVLLHALQRAEARLLVGDPRELTGTALSLLGGLSQPLGKASTSAKTKGALRRGEKRSIRPAGLNVIGGGGRCLLQEGALLQQHLDLSGFGVVCGGQQPEEKETTLKKRRSLSQKTLHLVNVVA